MLHWSFFLDMRIASIRVIFAFLVGVGSSFPSSAAFAADDFSGKRIAILILCITLLDFHILGALVNHGLCCFKILRADDRFVMFRDVVLRLFTIINASERKRNR